MFSYFTRQALALRYTILIELLLATEKLSLS
jgi:hypothetical protein